MNGARRRLNAAERSWTMALLRLRAFGRRRAWAIAFFGFMGFAGSSFIDVIRGGPLPAFHDEFSYLLAADTFASGRLSTPPHAHWEHFETFHVLSQPTYASKYPPAQGLVLAASQSLTGSPKAGVWLGVGMMAAAITWMLLIWLPPQWAVLAAALGTVQLCWVSYWGHSYWGGAVAAFGGALALGAYRRLSWRPNAAIGAILGAGLGVLAASRPYEGGVAGLCIAVGLARRLLIARGHSLRQLLRALLPAACLVAITLAWLGYYNWRVTGSTLTMPHQLYQSQYSVNPLLFVDGSAPPAFRHAEMERVFREWGERQKESQGTPLGMAKVAPLKILGICFQLLGVGLVGIVGLPRILRRRSLRFAFLTAAAVLGAALLTVGSYPHYVAPVASLFYVALGASVAQLHRRAVQTRSANLALVVVSALVITLPFQLLRAMARAEGFAQNHAAVARELESLPEKSLVFVRYGPAHSINEDWVHNRADIDSAKVVWARTMSDPENQRLVDYFADRKVWRIAPDESLELEPYSP